MQIIIINCAKYFYKFVQAYFQCCRLWLYYHRGSNFVNTVICDSWHGRPIFPVRICFMPHLFPTPTRNYDIGWNLDNLLSSKYSVGRSWNRGKSWEIIGSACSFSRLRYPFDPSNQRWVPFLKIFVVNHFIFFHSVYQWVAFHMTKHLHPPYRLCQL